MSQVPSRVAAFTTSRRSSISRASPLHTTSSSSSSTFPGIERGRSRRARRSSSVRRQWSPCSQVSRSRDRLRRLRSFRGKHARLGGTRAGCVAFFGDGRATPTRRPRQPSIRPARCQPVAGRRVTRSSANRGTRERAASRRAERVRAGLGCRSSRAGRRRHLAALDDTRGRRGPACAPRGARPPVLLVHAGPRPGGLAPHESRSRFSWSIEA